MLVHSFVASQGFRFLLLSVFKWLLLFCSEGYFPASGYRNWKLGEFLNASTAGHCWCSSSGGGGYSPFNSTFLRFLSTDIGPVFGHVRAHGFPVRCVQELAVILY